MGTHRGGNGECSIFPIAHLLLDLPLLKEIRSNLRDNIFRLGHLLASQRAGVLKPVSLEEKSKFIGSNNFLKEDGKLTKLLLSRMGNEREESKKERILLLGI